MPPSIPEFASPDAAMVLPRPRGALAAAIFPWLRLKLLAGGAVMALLLLCGAAAPLLAPQDPNLQDLAHALVAPQGLGAGHMLGTDHLGRDILSRILYGARVSLLIACAVALI